MKAWVIYPMKWKWFDSEITCIDTAEGRLTLKGLFIPMFIEQLLMNMMGTVNTLVLGHYADEAVAAVGAANQVMGLIYTFYAVVSGGASIVISHRLGAGDNKGAEKTAFSAFIVGTGISILCSGIMAALAVPVITMLNLEGSVLQMAVGYFRICVGFSFLQGIISVLSAVLRSYGHPKEAVTVSLLMNVMNAVLNILIVYRPIEIPLHGTEGIAIANVISHVIGVGFIAYYFLRSGISHSMWFRDWKALACVKEILHVGLPGGIGSLSYAMSQVVSTSILAVLGTIALSTKVYISSVVFYVSVVGYSLGVSAAILIGWMVGAGEIEKAYRLNKQVLRIAVGVNLILSVLVFLFYRFLIGLFTDNQAIIEMAQWILFIDIFVEIGRAFNHVEENSLRGAGDVIYPMVIAMVSCWMLSILFSYILGIKCQLGLYGCWIAFMMDELFRGIMLWRRFSSKKWVGKKV